jgi:flavin-dependent dehydrogenase
MMQLWDAIVAGAGPAGISAASALSRRGHRVMLADKIRPIHKIGEALPGAALRILQCLDFPVPTMGGPHATIGGNLSAWGSDKLTATDFIGDPSGVGWRLDRNLFEAELLCAAVRHGVVYRETRVAAVEPHESGWNLRFDDGGLESARWVVDATGRRGSLARRMGTKRFYELPLIALYTISHTDVAFPSNRTVIESVPDGWWYAAQLPSRCAIVGLHTHSAEAAAIRSNPSRWIRRMSETRHIAPMVNGSLRNELLQPALASGSRVEQFFGDRWISSGDAALSFDPISGQGIFSALLSGLEAGLAVSDVLSGRTGAMEEYCARMETVWNTYRARRRLVYREERRWPKTPFWSAFLQ